MFSGKTTELIKRVNRDRMAGLDVVAIKSRIDSRYAKTRKHKSFIVCHSGARLVGVCLVSLDTYLSHLEALRFQLSRLVLALQNPA